MIVGIIGDLEEIIEQHKHDDVITDEDMSWKKIAEHADVTIIVPSKPYIEKNPELKLEYIAKEYADMKGRVIVKGEEKATQDFYDMFRKYREVKRGEVLGMEKNIAYALEIMEKGYGSFKAIANTMYRKEEVCVEQDIKVCREELRISTHINQAEMEMMYDYTTRGKPKKKNPRVWGLTLSIIIGTGIYYLIT